MKVDPDFWRRLKLYLIGFGIGMLIVSVLFKDRSACKMPGRLKKEELQSQDLALTDTMKCQMKCRNISVDDVARVMARGSIDYSSSDPQRKPYGIYAMEYEMDDARELQVMIEDCDTISRLVGVNVLKVKYPPCDCK